MSYISDSLTPEKLTLPLIPLGGVAAFPAVPLNFEVGDAPSISAARSANATDSFVMLLSLTHPTEGDYKEEDFYRVGTIAKIKQAVQTPEGHTRLLCEGYARAELVTLHRLADHYVADVLCYLPESTSTDHGLHGEALLREAKRALRDMTAFIPNPNEDEIE